MLSNCSAGEKTLESPLDWKEIKPVHPKGNQSWKFIERTDAVAEMPILLQSGHWCEELTHCKRPWCWERLKVGEVGDKGWDGWMASLTQWTWVWLNSGSWWWTGRPGVLQSWGHKSQTPLSDWTELVLTIVNSAAMNIRMHVSSWIMIFRDGTAGSYSNFIFSF